METATKSCFATCFPNADGSTGGDQIETAKTVDQTLFVQMTIRDVRHGSDIANYFPRNVHRRGHDLRPHHPAIAMQEAVLIGEQSTSHKRLVPYRKGSLPIIRVQRFSPARAQSDRLFHAGQRTPAII